VRAQSENPNRVKLKSASAVFQAAVVLTKIVPLLLAPLFIRRWGWRRWLLFTILVCVGVAVFVPGAGLGLIGDLDGRGVFGTLRIYASQWNFNANLYHWLEAYLTGYRSPGAAPFEVPYIHSILFARGIVSALLALILLATALLAWRLDELQRGTWRQRILCLLRLAVLPLGAYLLLTPTLHPWYLTIIVPFIPFLLADREEGARISRFIWTWLYLSCAVTFFYLSYIDPNNFQEFSLARQVEYIPFYLLLLWAALSSIPGLQRRSLAT